MGSRDPLAQRTSQSQYEPRRRDATDTRRRLLAAARRRFARDGYSATTVRDIADDVGVNIALINRYFGSKEGLFGACLDEAVRDLVRSSGEVRGLPQVAEEISRQTVGASSQGGLSEVLLLLLRSSEDEDTEKKRIGVLRSYGLKMASAAGWAPDALEADELLLRAQLVLSAAIGIVVLRSCPGLEPLRSATEGQLRGPIHDLVVGAFGPSPTRRSAPPT
jgi:AcrR family transcriptional regulator